MERPRPQQPSSLGAPPSGLPGLQVSTIPMPNAGSTIYVSPSVSHHAPYRQQHHPQLPHPLLQSDTGADAGVELGFNSGIGGIGSGDGAPPRRAPKRATRGEVGVGEERSGIWGPNNSSRPPAAATVVVAKTDAANRNGHEASPGLGTSPEDRDSSTASPTAAADQPRKKQKRNKPTLSCFECVERKTKVCAFFGHLPQQFSLNEPISQRVGQGGHVTRISYPNLVLCLAMP